MEFGIGHYPTHDSVHPADLARMVEARGHNTCLYLAEHTHVPGVAADRLNLPRRMAHLYDPFVALTAAATVTSRLRFGTGICLVAERDPIITAKQVASLDAMSGGRFDFGVGAGWLTEELLHHGVDPKTRLRSMSERLAAMKAIWTQDEASFHGEFVTFDRVRSWPKPAQSPHPPILIGGDGPKLFEQVLIHADAWMPNFARDASGGVQILERARRMWDSTDRRIDLVVVSAPADPAALERLAAGGARRVIHWINATGPTGIRRSLDAWEAAIDDFAGESAARHRSTADALDARMDPAGGGESTAAR